MLGICQWQLILTENGDGFDKRHGLVRCPLIRIWSELYSSQRITLALVDIDRLRFARTFAAPRLSGLVFHDGFERKGDGKVVRTARFHPSAMVLPRMPASRKLDATRNARIHSLGNRNFRPPLHRTIGVERLAAVTRECSLRMSVATFMTGRAQAERQFPSRRTVCRPPQERRTGAELSQACNSADLSRTVPAWRLYSSIFRQLSPNRVARVPRGRGRPAIDCQLAASCLSIFILNICAVRQLFEMNKRVIGSR